MTTRLRRISLLFFAIVVGVFGLLLALPAHATDAPDGGVSVITSPPPMPADGDSTFLIVLKALPQLVKLTASGNWSAALGLILITILAVAATHRSGMTSSWKWLTTDAGSAVWTFFVTTVGLVGTNLIAGIPILTVGSLTTIAVVGFGSGGIYTFLRKLLGENGGIGARFPFVKKVVDFLGPAQPALVPAKAS
jgi:hypothetical protein